MRKLFSLLAAVLFAGSMIAADAVMAPGTNGYNDFTVNDMPAVKVGKSNDGGDMTVTVGSGATSMTVYAAAWKGVNTLILNIAAPEGVTITPNYITLSGEDAFTGSDKAFTVADVSAYKYDFTISGADEGATFTFATATKKRFLMWDATYEASVSSGWSEIVFVTESSAGELDGTRFSNGTDFYVEAVDPENKMSVEYNVARFGFPEDSTSYFYRLKGGGKSSSIATYLTANIPAKGLLRFAARTGSNSATDRALVVTQDGDTLYNQVVQEADSIPIGGKKYYQYVYVPVSEGEVKISFPVGGINFYSFAFREDSKTPACYIVGSMTEWIRYPEYRMTANPANPAEYMLDMELYTNSEFKVVTTYNPVLNYKGEVMAFDARWYPASDADGDHNYGAGGEITEAGNYTVYFRPDEQGGDDWFYHCIYAAKIVPLPDPTNCEEAAAAAMTVSKNNELYNNGMVYEIQGYVTEIAYPYDETKGNMSFWMADTKDGGKVLEAYKCSITDADNVPGVGDLVLVTGSLTKYDEIPEFAAGCSVIIIERAPLADGFYLVGTMNSWTAAAEYQLTLNTGAEVTEYMFDIALNTNDQFKIRQVSEGNETTWYPGDPEDNYIVAEDGDYTIYFRPDYDGAEDWFQQCIYLDKKEVPVIEPITCLDVYQMATNDTVLLLNDVTVTYAHGQYVWVRDASASLLIFLPTASEAFMAGHILSGVCGVVYIYNGVHEIKPTAAQVDEINIMAGEVPAPIQTVDVEVSDVNKYIVMPNVSFDADTAFEEGSSKNITINGVSVRNQFKNGFAFEAGKKYNIYGVVMMYNDAPQVYFINAEEASDTDIDETIAAGKAAKILRNGQILIRKTDKTYNVMGATIR